MAELIPTSAPTQTPTPAPMIVCQVQQADFSVHDCYSALANLPQCGAVVLFTGLVRQQFDDALLALELEHYPGMTEHAMLDIAQQACARFDAHALTLIHRVGVLKAQEQIVLVGVAAPHRQQAFDACQFVMDFLKNQVPIWKKVHLKNQHAEWVDAKASDKQALNRW